MTLELWKEYDISNKIPFFRLCNCEFQLLMVCMLEKAMKLAFKQVRYTSVESTITGERLIIDFRN